MIHDTLIDPTTHWTEVAPGAPVHSTCGNCPPRPGALRWNDNPDPGFGIMRLRRDGAIVAERIATGWGSLTAVRGWRRWARNEPDHTWTLEVESPMTGIRYTRQRTGQWIATHRSMGFA